METITVQVLQTMGRWFVIILLLTCQAGYSQPTASFTESSVWHNALFIFCICFFVAGFIVLFMMKSREDHKNKMHARYLRHRGKHKI